MRAFAVAVVITLVLGACAGDDSGASQGTTKLANPTTGPAETAPAETADRGENPEPPPLAERAQLGTVTSSGGGCALEIDAETIRAGAGRLTVVNETDRSVVFELFRLASEATFGSLEAGDLVASFGPSNPTSNFFLVEREVRPGASGTITDYFTTGDAFTVVCAHLHAGSFFLGDANRPRSPSSARSWCRSGRPGSMRRDRRGSRRGSIGLTRQAAQRRVA